MFIYAIEDSEGIYVGKSKQPTWKRWSKHRYLLHRNRHHCQKLQCAWNERGELVFVFKVLAVFDNERALDQAERDTITRYRAQGANVYNTR